MNRILDITLHDSEIMNKFVAQNRVFFQRETDRLDPFEPFTCRYTTPNIGVKVLMHVDYPKENNGIHLRLEQEASALLVRKVFPSFEITAESRNGHLRVIKQPNDPLIRHWLYEHTGSNHRTNLEEMYFIVVNGAYAVFVLGDILLQRQSGDTIEYRFPAEFADKAIEYVYMKTVEYARTHILDGWDVVTLTEKQYQKVIEANVQHGVEYDIDNIPLPKFCLSIYDGKSMDYYFFEKKGNSIRCGVTDTQNFITKYFYVDITEKSEKGIGSTLRVEGDESMYKWLNEPCGENGEGNWEWCADAFFIINTFMLHFGDVTMEVETKVAQAPTQTKHQKKNKTNAVRLFKTYKLVKNWKSQARKKAEITCPAWGVRGHFRHYRNGKTIFVEAYVKGKEKDKYKGKEYALLPYKEA